MPQVSGGVAHRQAAPRPLSPLLRPDRPAARPPRRSPRLLRPPPLPLVREAGAVHDAIARTARTVSGRLDVRAEQAAPYQRPITEARQMTTDAHPKFHFSPRPNRAGEIR